MDVAQDGEHSSLLGGLVGDRTVHDLASAGVVDDLESALRQGGTEARTRTQKDGGRVRKTSDAGPDHRHSNRSLEDYGEGTIVGQTAMGQDSPGVALCQSIWETIEPLCLPLACRREKKPQHRSGAFRPGGLCMLRTLRLAISQVFPELPAFLDEPIAQRSRIR